MNYVIEFFINKFSTVSFPIKLSNDLSISEWKHETSLTFDGGFHVSVNRYIVDNKLCNQFTKEPIYNYVTVHHTQYYGCAERQWQIWFHYHTWLSDAYKKIYGDYEGVSFSSLKEAKKRVDTFLHKIQKLKMFL